MATDFLSLLADFLFWPFFGGLLGVFWGSCSYYCGVTGNCSAGADLTSLALSRLSLSSSSWMASLSIASSVQPIYWMNQLQSITPSSYDLFSLFELFELPELILSHWLFSSPAVSYTPLSGTGWFFCLEFVRDLSLRAALSCFTTWNIFLSILDASLL